MKQYLWLYFLLFPAITCFGQNRYDIIISEIMADPSPSVGLPNIEWIELKNRSSSAIQLLGWRIGDGTSLSGQMPGFLLLPDSFVIVCGTNSFAAMSAYGSCIAVSGFPSLDNNGELLFIKTAVGSVIHGLSYSSRWYRNDLKQDGGWSLEMINPGYPCAGEANWQASEDSKGGTPGGVNSGNAIFNDESPPEPLFAVTTDSTTILLTYNKSVDSSSAVFPSHYVMDGGLTISHLTVLPPLFNTVELKINSPLLFNKIYLLTISGVGDCNGNAFSSSQTIKTGIPAAIGLHDIVINEILFNPKPGGSDFVEFYNRSNKIADASKLFIANRSLSNSINSISPLSPYPFYIFPGDYVTVTEDETGLWRDYFIKDRKTILFHPSLPSFPDDKGFVLLLNTQGEITDEVAYNDDWHFKLLNNTEGISLERIDPGASSQDARNWHSAASTVGYATPGYRNSQLRNPAGIDASIKIIPEIFSPDNDGFDDVVSIYYKLNEPGYVANITIFDAAGRMVRNLVHNELPGNSGYWNWDGLNDKRQQLAVGAYIILSEFFTLQGKKNQFKNVVILARKLN